MGDDKKKYIKRASVAIAGGAAIWLLVRWARGSDQAPPAPMPASECLSDENFGDKFLDCLSIV